MKRYINFNIYSKFLHTNPALPDFLSIGSPRSATTWLYTNLAKHPEIFVPSLKELHFFDDGIEKGPYNLGIDFNKNSHWKWYYAIYKQGQGKLKGDITPSYMILPLERIQLVKRNLPNVKLIMGIRNPVERIWSGIKRSIYFDKGLNPNKIDYSYINMYMSKQRLYSRSDFISAIKNWETVFNQRSIYYYFYSDVRNRPIHVLSSIAKFLGVNSNLFDYNFKSINESPEKNIPQNISDILYLRLNDQLEFLYNKFGRIE